MISETIIKQCKQNNRAAQRQLYDALSAKLYYTCKRYLSREDEIEDLVTESFVTIFSKIHQLKESGAIEGWAKRIAINKCLAKLKQQVSFTVYLDDVSSPNLTVDSLFEQNGEQILDLLEELPKGCKTIFNLFVIEGYNHKEIAEQLGISVGTSKSQLNVAKKKLQQLVAKHYYSNPTTNEHSK